MVQVNFMVSAPNGFTRNMMMEAVPNVGDTVRGAGFVGIVKSVEWVTNLPGAYVNVRIDKSFAQGKAE